MQEGAGVAGGGAGRGAEAGYAARAFGAINFERGKADLETKLVDAEVHDGKLFVTFGDGKVALIEPGDLRAFAVDPGTLTTVPIDPESCDARE